MTGEVASTAECQSRLEGRLGMQQREVVDQCDVTGTQLVVQPELVAHRQRGKGPAAFQGEIGFEGMGNR